MLVIVCTCVLQWLNMTLVQHSKYMYHCILFHQNGWSPLFASSLNVHLDVVKKLIEAGANVNQAEKVGVASVLS